MERAAIETGSFGRNYTKRTRSRTYQCFKFFSSNLVISLNSEQKRIQKSVMVGGRLFRVSGGGAPRARKKLFFLQN